MASPPRMSAAAVATPAAFPNADVFTKDPPVFSTATPAAEGATTFATGEAAHAMNLKIFSADRNAPPVAPAGYANIVLEDLLPKPPPKTLPLWPPPPHPLDFPIPIPGISSGMLPCGLEYPYLPRGTPVLQKPPELTMMDLYQAQGERAEFAVGKPVTICGLASQQGRQYNGLIGDIVEATTSEFDGEIVFVVRAPLRHPATWWPMSQGQAHVNVPVSNMALNCVLLNQSILMKRSVHELVKQERHLEPWEQAERNRALLPYILVHGVPPTALMSLQGWHVTQVFKAAETAGGSHEIHHFGLPDPGADDERQWPTRPSANERRVGQPHESSSKTSYYVM